MKKLIAYSSVAHMGIVTLGIFTFNQQGLSGALFTMLAHGVVSGALFLCVGVLYDRVHSREIAALRRRREESCRPMRWSSCSSPWPRVGLPGTADFVGEFLVIVGAWRINPWVALRRRDGHDPRRRPTCSGSIAGSSSAAITRDDVRALLDLSPREYAVFAPLIILTLWMGIYPQPFLSFFEATVAALVARHEAALSISRLAGM